MWYPIFKFELQYRIKRPETYVFFIFLLLFSIVGVDFIFQGATLGGVKLNSSLVIAKTMGAITGIFMILASMIMGVSVLRDFEYQMESLVFVNPIKKRDYLLGRFLGSFAVLLFIFSGVLWGMMLGELMPWHDPNDYLPFRPIAYVSSFVMITLPILFFGAALFFVSGALSKKLVVVYTQGIIFFVIFMLTKSISNEFWQAILDPFSLTTLSVVTESWTVLEKNSRLIPFEHVLRYNKLFWLFLGVLTLLFGFKKFNFNVVQSTRLKKKAPKLSTNAITPSTVAIPKVQIQNGFRSKWIQLKELSQFYFISICKLPSFWAIVICGMIIILVNSVSLGTVYGVDSYPATYFIVEELQETSLYFFIIIMLFYSGELIWKERSAKLNLMYDASAISSFINLLGKYVGLNLIYMVVMVVLIISGIIFQAVNGYYQFEFHVYFYGFFLEILPFLALYTLLSFFIQALTNHKFIGILTVLVLFIAINVLEFLGFDHDLYLFGGDALPKYSDMNGYGHFLLPYFTLKTYWFLFGIILLILSSVLIVRGTETRLFQRLKLSRQRMSKPFVKFTSWVVIAFLFFGSFIFYNTNVLNTYWTPAEATQFRIDYEKTLKKFEYFPQPKITDINLEVELFPSERKYIAEGYYILTNTTEIAMSEIHIQKLIESNLSLERLTFEGGAVANSEYDTYDYTIYELNSPLEAGESVKMNFKQVYTAKGFGASGSNANMVKNGTFFSNKDFPTLGYNRKYELQDNKERADYGLAERPNKASREDANELINGQSSGDSDGTNFEIILGTEKDQTALAPGNLLKEWSENDRNYFHYKMDQPMINFYSIVSARYEVKKDKWISETDVSSTPVDLEVYYHETHDYNVNRMMEAMKASLDYYSFNFSPYQYKQIRIMEFPRYADFAQSFPGTVPFSEAIGFVLDIDDAKDVDMAFYITAHEVAHQWFGMQVEAANVKGRHLILETLSQYAALMVLKNYYSEEKVQQFLTLQKDKYLDGKRRGASEEPSLALVENQDYIYYAKGAINMYTLQEIIGEDQVNLAIKRFIEDWNTHDGHLKIKTKRYATTKDLLSYFKAVTPVHLQRTVSDLFESVGEPVWEE